MKKEKPLPSGSLIASAYDDGDNSENRIRFWLEKTDQWSLDEAAAILCFIEPNSVKWSADGGLLEAKSLMRYRPREGSEDEQDDVDADDNSRHQTLEAAADELRDAKRTIGGVGPKRHEETPAAWIEIALARGLVPVWLAWAQRVGLFKVPPQHAPIAEKPLSTKERRSYLKIIAALCAINKLDIHSSHKAVIGIQNQCEQLGLPLAAGTIRTALQAANDLSPDK